MNEKFQVITNHQNLTYFKTPQKLNEYDYTIFYAKGTSNKANPFLWRSNFNNGSNSKIIRIKYYFQSPNLVTLKPCQIPGISKNHLWNPMVLRSISLNLAPKYQKNTNDMMVCSTINVMCKQWTTKCWVLQSQVQCNWEVMWFTCRVSGFGNQCWWAF